MGKIITSSSDFDPQPIFILDTGYLSCELKERMISAVNSNTECISIRSSDWEEIKKHNVFSLKKFPCLIDGYVDVEI
jgi:hypothetical protein